MHSAKRAVVEHAPDTLNSLSNVVLVYVAVLAFATVAICKKNLALAIGITGSGEAVVAAGQVALSAVVLSFIHISWDKKAEESVALVTVTLFKANVDKSLGTITTTFAECLVPELIKVELSVILAFVPTA